MAHGELAEGLVALQGGPGWSLNCWVLDDVLVDSGMWWSARRLQRQLRGTTIRAHALTHAHGDHAGGTHRLTSALALPLWVGEGDAAGVAAGDVATHGRPVVDAVMRVIAPVRPQSVARRLDEGDVVGGFTVLDAPGHSPGAVAYWRERDRVLICGDVLSNLTPGRPRVRELPALLSHDAAANHRSARRLAVLRPALACFGHGPPARDPGLFAAAVDGAVDGS